MIYRKIGIVFLSVLVLFTLSLPSNEVVESGKGFKISYMNSKETGGHGLEVSYFVYTNPTGEKMLAVYGENPSYDKFLSIRYNGKSLTPDKVGSNFIATTKLSNSDSKLNISYNNEGYKKANYTIEIPSAIVPKFTNLNLEDDPGYGLRVIDAKGRGATWNTCQPIKYIINTNNAPAGAEEFVKTTMTEIEQQTGIDLEYGGLTKANLWSKSKKNNPLNFKQTVTIKWDDKDLGSGSIERGALGYALFSHQSIKNREVIRTGVIVFSTKYFNTTTTISPVDKEVLLHEFGHILNLTHTSREDQVMYHSTDISGNNNHASYQEKDLIGIANVKRKKC